MCAAIGSPFEVTGTVHLPAPRARLRHAGLRSAGAGDHGARIENFRRASSAIALAAMEPLDAYGEIEEIDRDSLVAFWARAARPVGAAEPRRAPCGGSRPRPGTGRSVVRTTPALHACRSHVRLVAAACLARRPPSTMPARPIIRRALAVHGGHATLLRARSDGARRGRGVSAAVAAGERLTERAEGGASIRTAFSIRAECTPAFEIAVARSSERARRSTHADQFHTRATQGSAASPRPEKILRTCVHCGLCTATCPTYLLLGDELDSPRGRIYLIKDMLENGRPAERRRSCTMSTAACRCLSCMTTCPSGVHYMHLVDHARALHREDLRAPLAGPADPRCWRPCCPIRGASALALLAAPLGRPFSRLMRRVVGLERLAAMLELAPRRAAAPRAIERPGTCDPAEGERRAPGRAC